MENDFVIIIFVLDVLCNLCFYVWVMMCWFKFWYVFSWGMLFRDYVMLIKIVIFDVLVFDNLFVWIVLVGMGINIKVMNSEEIYRMLEFMVVVNYYLFVKIK